MSADTKPDVEYLTSEAIKGLPFSEAVRVGKMLYLSGQIGVDSSMKLVPGGIEPETRKPDYLSRNWPRQASCFSQLAFVNRAASVGASS